MVKIWYLSPKNANIEVVNVKDLTFERIKKCFLECETIETVSFKLNGWTYSILMNEVGVFEDLTVNECAHKLFTKLKLHWGWTVFGKKTTGKFVVAKYRENEAHNDFSDMDLTPVEFIKEFNKVLQKRADEEMNIVKNSSKRCIFTGDRQYIMLE